jgi:hypothetical protein
MRVTMIAAIFLGIGVSVAYADSIDGDWCNEVDGARLRIDGATIELQSGQTITGEYSRHAFRYVAPDGAPDAGATIDYVMRSEEQMRRVRNGNAMPEHDDLWRRCQSIS